MKLKSSTFLLMAGIILILATACFFTADFIADKRASADLLNTGIMIEQLLPERSAGFAEERLDYTMPAMEIDGTDYVLLINAAGYGSAIPVKAEWNEKNIKRNVCRYTGSTWNGTLVIGGGLIENGLGFMKSVDIGDSITVTDMTGCVFSYRVETVKHPEKISGDMLVKSDADLILFAKAKTGYIVVKSRMI